MSFLESFRRNREEIIDTIRTSPENIPDLLHRDSETEEVEEDDQLRFCQKKKTLLDFRIGWIESPSIVNCDGTDFIFTTSEVPEIFIERDERAKVRAERLISEHPRMKLCQCNFDRAERYFALDTFTNRTIVRYIVQDIFEEMKLPHCSTLHHAYVKNKEGYTIYDMIDLGSFQDFLRKIELTPKIAEDLIKQLVVIFSVLSEFDYNHGTASSQSLLFREEPVSYEYKGMKVDAEFVAQLTDMWHSSITYYGNHFYEKSEVDVMPRFIPEIEQRLISPAYCEMHYINDLTRPLACPASSKEHCFTKNDYQLCERKDILFFRFGGNTFEIYQHMRHLGIPLYTGSFDFYCIMISLMCDKRFYDMIKSHSSLERIWAMMWLSEDYVAVENLLIEQHGKPEIAIDHYTKVRQAVDILRKRFLRCDILSEMLRLFREDN